MNTVIQNLPPVLYVNLDRAVQRREKLEAAMARTLPPGSRILRIPAVDGYQIRDSGSPLPYVGTFAQYTLRHRSQWNTSVCFPCAQTRHRTRPTGELGGPGVLPQPREVLGLAPRASGSPGLSLGTQSGSPTGERGAHPGGRRVL